MISKQTNAVFYIAIMLVSHRSFASHVRFQLPEDSYNRMYQHLKIAIKKDDVAVVEICKDQSFNFNRLNSKNKNFLHYAAQVSALKCIQSLVKVDADINQQDYKGRTPLHFAAYWNIHDDIVETLLAAGADKSLSNIEGKIPFDYAVSHSMRQLLRPDVIHLKI